jgi:octanoyl-[GcvH]:protein N-octanoyltransferase
MSALVGGPEVDSPPCSWPADLAMAACEEALRAGRAALSVYRPAPTVAFSRRDALDRHFPQAVTAAERAGFRPVVRLAGGSVVAYDEGCLVVDLVGPRDHRGTDERFETFSAGIVEALRGLGVPAGVGAVAGEYCPGGHSVNVGGRTKLAGTAQRVTLQGWLCSAVLVVRCRPALVRVLDDVHRALRRTWDPGSVGAVRSHVDVTEDQVRDALVRSLAG